MWTRIKTNMEPKRWCEQRPLLFGKPIIWAKTKKCLCGLLFLDMTDTVVPTSASKIKRACQSTQHCNRVHSSADCKGWHKNESVSPCENIVTDRLTRVCPRKTCLICCHRMTLLIYKYCGFTFGISNKWRYGSRMFQTINGGGLRPKTKTKKKHYENV